MGILLRSSERNGRGCKCCSSLGSSRARWYSLKRTIRVNSVHGTSTRILLDIYAFWYTKIHNMSIMRNFLPFAGSIVSYTPLLLKEGQGWLDLAHYLGPHFVEHFCYFL